MTGMREVCAAAFDHFHSLLQMNLAICEVSDNDRGLLGYIRHAASRLDELEYGVLVQNE
jgi:hypothetical protein